jgi:hypothetical protein
LKRVARRGRSWWDSDWHYRTPTAIRSRWHYNRRWREVVAIHKRKCDFCARDVPYIHGIFVLHNVGDGGSPRCRGSNLSTAEVDAILHDYPFRERFPTLQSIVDSHRTIGQILREEQQCQP